MQANIISNLRYILQFSTIVLTIILGPQLFAQENKFSQAVELVQEKQFTQAYKIFMELAETQDPDAQYNVAILLRRGLGHPTNYMLALKWSWLAQLGGVYKAKKLSQSLIELIPEEKVETVKKKVKEVLEARLENKDSEVILQFADYYINIATEPDYKSAYALRSLAAALGIKNASRLRNALEEELEPEDLISSQSQAQEMFKKFVD